MTFQGEYVCKFLSTGGNFLFEIFAGAYSKLGRIQKERGALREDDIRQALQSSVPFKGTLNKDALLAYFSLFLDATLRLRLDPSGYLGIELIDPEASLLDLFRKLCAVLDTKPYGRIHYALSQFAKGFEEFETRISRKNSSAFGRQQSLTQPNRHLQDEFDAVQNNEVIIRLLARMRKVGMDMVFPQSAHDKVLACVLAAFRSLRVPAAHREIIDLVVAAKEAKNITDLQEVTKTKIRGAIAILKHAEVFVSHSEDAPLAQGAIEDKDREPVRIELRGFVHSFADLRARHDQFLGSFCAVEDIRLPRGLRDEVFWNWHQPYSAFGELDSLVKELTQYFCSSGIAAKLGARSIEAFKSDCLKRARFVEPPTQQNVRFNDMSSTPQAQQAFKDTMKEISIVDRRSKEPVHQDGRDHPSPKGVANLTRTLSGRNTPYGSHNSTPKHGKGCVPGTPSTSEGLQVHDAPNDFSVGAPSNREHALQEHDHVQIMPRDSPHVSFAPPNMHIFSTRNASEKMSAAHYPVPMMYPPPPGLQDMHRPWRDGFPDARPPVPQSVGPVIYSSVPYESCDKVSHTLQTSNMPMNLVPQYPTSLAHAACVGYDHRLGSDIAEMRSSQSGLEPLPPASMENHISAPHDAGMSRERGNDGIIAARSHRVSTLDDPRQTLSQSVTRTSAGGTGAQTLEQHQISLRNPMCSVENLNTAFSNGPTFDGFCRASSLPNKWSDSGFDFMYPLGHDIVDMALGSNSSDDSTAQDKSETLSHLPAKTLEGPSMILSKGPTDNDDEVSGQSLAQILHRRSGSSAGLPAGEVRLVDNSHGDVRDFRRHYLAGSLLPDTSFNAQNRHEIQTAERTELDDGLGGHGKDGSLSNVIHELQSLGRVGVGVGIHDGFAALAYGDPCRHCAGDCIEESMAHITPESSVNSVDTQELAWHAQVLTRNPAPGGVGRKM